MCLDAIPAMAGPSSRASLATSLSSVLGILRYDPADMPVAIMAYISFAMLTAFSYFVVSVVVSRMASFENCGATVVRVTGSNHGVDP